MCRRIAEGTRWSKCGHFQRHIVTTIIDCTAINCERSYYHPKDCRLRTCINQFGPEIQQDVDTVDEYCFACRAAQAKAAGIPLR
ncbi:hypothetical protein CPC08DRAFT_736071 [Agrocybe pediades]|nr:hypothetical protein CPC08DRAFT_736071 [Agrocybe pediades]